MARQTMLRAALPDAYQCGRCGHGPVLHGNCSNLSTHHGEVIRGTRRVRRSNACAKCGWFVNDIRDWPRWDGKLASEDDSDAQSAEAEPGFLSVLSRSLWRNSWRVETLINYLVGAAICFLLSPRVLACIWWGLCCIWWMMSSTLRWLQSLFFFMFGLTSFMAWLVWTPVRVIMAIAQFLFGLFYNHAFCCWVVVGVLVLLHHGTKVLKTSKTRQQKKEREERRATSSKKRMRRETQAQQHYQTVQQLRQVSNKAVKALTASIPTQSRRRSGQR